MSPWALTVGELFLGVRCFPLGCRSAFWCLAHGVLTQTLSVPVPTPVFPFQWKTYNPAFSQLEIWFRFVFVVLTFIVIVSSVASAPVTEDDTDLSSSSQ